MPNNINGEKMIIDIELTAKPITDEFWILTHDDKKEMFVLTQQAMECN